MKKKNYSFEEAMEVINTRDESKICKYFGVKSIDELLEVLNYVKEHRSEM